ncbi:MAG: hypothetical protein ACRYG7_17000 [Janthinobacterium lividum]
MFSSKPICRLAFGALPLLLAACHPEHPAELPSGGLAALRGTWLLDPESSRGDTLAYRRNTYRFRYRPGGRPGFRLGPGGSFTRYEVAPGGGLLAQEGTWAEVGQDRLIIHLPQAEPAEPDYQLEVLAWQQGVLKLRRSRPAAVVH